MIEESGPWMAGVASDGRVFVESDDFTHDVRLYVNGDFTGPEQKLEYAREIVKRLNAFSPDQAPRITAVHGASVYFAWEWPGTGFGELAFTMTGSKIAVDAEGMGPDETRQILYALANYVAEHGKFQ